MYSSYNFIPITFMASNQHFYELFQLMSSQLEQKDQQIQQLRKKYQDLQALCQSFQSEKVIKDSKISEIPEIEESGNSLRKLKPKRTIYCQYDNCDKAYASSLALNLHIKNKHNGGTKKERDAYAKLIALAQIKGQPRPEINFKFPRNYIQNIKQKLLQEMKNEKF